jgi:BRCT domain type II-containing protein
LILRLLRVSRRRQANSSKKTLRSTKLRSRSRSRRHLTTREVDEEVTMDIETVETIDVEDMGDIEGIGTIEEEGVDTTDVLPSKHVSSVHVKDTQTISREKLYISLLNLIW